MYRLEEQASIGVDGARLREMTALEKECRKGKREKKRDKEESEVLCETEYSKTNRTKKGGSELWSEGWEV